MTTPVLSKTQSKKSALVKKSLAKGLKNVLARPEENYWPLVNESDPNDLENLLQRLLPVLKRSRVTIPWSQLRKMDKKERSAARKAAQIECNPNCNEMLAKYVVFGINETTKLLEKDNALCIILEATIDPSLLIKHIIIMAKSKNIPVILVPFLKKITLQAIGFAAAVLCLKNNVKNSSENYFYPLFKEISKLSLQISQANTFVSSVSTETLKNKSSDNKEVIEKMEVDMKIDDKPCVISTDIYLYRKSTKERIFEPSNSSPTTKETGKLVFGDYIPLDTDKYVVDKKKLPSRFFGSIDSDKYNGKSSLKSNSERCSYKPLKVKRLKGNENRTKATKLPKTKSK